MATPLRVLIVEDSEDDALLLARQLRRGGFDVHHQRVDTPEALRSALVSGDWDLVISDFSMPHFSGHEALRIVRTIAAEIPFIFVSGTLGEETAVAALKEGAQDYLMKGRLQRLVPAVERELREARDRRDRRLLEQRLHQLQRFEAIGRLAGGIAHDFNNVLGAIAGWAELALADAPPGSRLEERINKVIAQTEQAARLTSQLLAFARKQLLQPRRIDLNALVEESLGLLRRVIGEQIEVRFLPGAGCVTSADPAQMDQVLMNLCLNARDAMAGGGRLTIETRAVEIDEDFCRRYTYARPGPHVLLSVSDTGPGMDAATVERIFEPFFTTKEVGKGTGLGLATVYGIVKQHGGFINVESAPGQGAAFHIYLPADSGAPEPRAAEIADRPRHGSETVLLAEDHDGLRHSAREMLETLGYRVLAAADGYEALRLFRQHASEIDVLVLDVVMPGLNGPTAYARMCELRPGLGVIFTTGYAEESAALAGAAGRAVILQKPYGPARLTHLIGAVLEAARPS